MSYICQLPEDSERAEITMYVYEELFICLLTVMAVAIDAHIRYQIEEGVPRGTVVGNVVDDARLRSRYSAADLNVMRFRFLVSSTSGGGVGAGPVGGNSGSALFEISATNGVIRTATAIDRDNEALCRRRRRCELSIDVITQPVQLFQIIKVRHLIHIFIGVVCRA